MLPFELRKVQRLEIASQIYEKRFDFERFS